MMRRLTKITFALFWLASVVALVVWARRADPITRCTIKSSDSETFLAMPRAGERCPILVLAGNRREDFLQKGPVIRLIAESGFICAYVVVDKQSIDQLGRQLTDILNDNRLARNVKEHGLVVIGEGTRASTMLTGAVKAAGVQPDVFVAVPDNAETGTVLDRLVKAREDLRCPIVIASKSKSVEATQSLHNSLPQEHIEVLAFEAADDFRPRDLFFYKQLAERARAKLVQTGKPSGAPLERQVEHSGWAYVWTLIVLMSLLAIMSLVQKATSKVARGTALIAGIFIGIGTGSFATHLPSAMHSLNAKRSAQLSGLMDKWMLPQTDAKTFTEYSSLSDYTRKLVNWKLDERIYTEYVLNPRIVTDSQPVFTWRQPLWKYFYPLIRKAATPSDAANILVNYLRLEVEVRALDPTKRNVQEIWRSRTATPIEFEQTYIAALRSTGIAAKLNSQGRAEIWDDGEWKAAPRPAELVAL